MREHLQEFALDSKNEEKTEVDNVSAPAYEAPAIESVVTRETLEREVQYAGFASGVVR